MLANENAPANNSFEFPAWLYDFKAQAMIIAVLAISLYANTFQNESAFDDAIVILKNEYVLQGISGINDILAKDSYDSYYRQAGAVDPLPGGRHRPLSIITFAIEQQFLGTVPPDKADSVARITPSFEMRSPYEKKLLRDMHVRHVFNVFLFTLSVLVLLYFLGYVVFRNNPLIAFLTALLFVLNPIHTEVVANVKNRDEILSLLFICLTFILAFKYRELHKKWLLGLALLSYFFAFLAHEYAITLVVLLPLAFYLFDGSSFKKSALAALPYALVAVAYLFIRFEVIHQSGDTVDNSIQNNVYAYATGTQKIATEIATSLSYLRLLLFPYPLCSDYSYNTIPYKEFSSPVVWLSVFVHLLLVVGLFYFTGKRHVLAFAIAFYLLNLVLVNNFVFYIGTSMGERLIYHSSVGFAIGVGYVLYSVFEKMRAGPQRTLIAVVFMASLGVLCGFGTLARNTAWKNNFTLCMNDIKTAPDSYLINENMAIMYNNKSEGETDEKNRDADLYKAIGYINKLTLIDSRNEKGYIYEYLAYFKLKQADSVLKNLQKVWELKPDYPDLEKMFFDGGVLFYKNAQYPKALYAWQWALKVRPDYPKAKAAIDILYNEHLLAK